MTRILLNCDIPDPRPALEADYGSPLLRSAIEASRLSYSARLPLREFEGARMRIALINGCIGCKGYRRSAEDVPAGQESQIPDEAFYQAVANWRRSPIFSARERLAIEYAERFALDHLSLDDDEAFWRRLHGAFSDQEIVDLTLSIGQFIAVGRFMHVLGLDSICPMPHAVGAR